MSNILETAALFLSLMGGVFLHIQQTIAAMRAYIRYANKKIRVLE